jgi:glycosyltransferase involved in cell wall biosynthesis
MNTIYIVIPSYNEDQMLPKTIQSLHKRGYQNIIVVDDGSSDQTEKIMSKNKNVVYIRHIINRGQGAAVTTGLEAAKMLDADMAITFDADGQHDPKDIQKLIETIQKGYDIVLGYRNLKKETMPVSKIIANSLANMVTKLFYGIQVKDSQSGLRAYSRKAIACIDTKSDRYEFYSEVLREINRHALRLAEVPITVYYTEYAMNKHNKQNMINALKTLYRLILSL